MYKQFTGADEETHGVALESFRVKSDLFEKRQSITFDFGGSVMKVVCALDEGDFIEIRMMSFPANELSRAISYLKTHHSNLLDKDETVYVTGVNSQIHLNTLVSELNIKYLVKSEMDCFVHGFKFLIKNFALSEITYPLSEEAISYKENTKQQMLIALKAIDNLPDDQKSHIDMSEVQATIQMLSEPVTNFTEAELYPCALAMLGSGGAFIVVSKEKISVIEGFTRCGKTFIGLAKLLTGVTDFKELTELATKGNSENLTVMGRHLRAKDSDSQQANIYSSIPEDMTVYSFGHAAELSSKDFSKEDTISALLDTIAQDLAQAIHLSALSVNIGNVFICGSFPGQSEVVRSKIAKHLITRILMRPPCKGKRNNAYFVKYGGYLGALGCLLDNLKERKGESETRDTKC